MLVEILEGSDGSSGVEVGLGHAVVGELDGVLVLPLVAVLEKNKSNKNILILSTDWLSIFILIEESLLSRNPRNLVLNLDTWMKAII